MQQWSGFVGRRGQETAVVSARVGPWSHLAVTVDRRNSKVWTGRTAVQRNVYCLEYCLEQRKVIRILHGSSENFASPSTAFTGKFQML